MPGKIYSEFLAGFLFGVVLQGHAVDAVAQSGGIGTVREDVAEMSLAFGAADLGPAREQRPVLVLAHRGGAGGGVEARPAGAGIVFRFRAEERRAAADAMIHAVALLLGIRMTEGALGSVLACHPKLIRRERLAPFRIGLDGFARFIHFRFQWFAHGWGLFLFSHCCSTAI